MGPRWALITRAEVSRVNTANSRVGIYELERWGCGWENNCAGICTDRLEGTFAGKNLCIRAIVRSNQYLCKV